MKLFKLFNIKNDDDQEEMEKWVTTYLTEGWHKLSFEQNQKKGFMEVQIVMTDDFDYDKDKR